MLKKFSELFGEKKQNAAPPSTADIDPMASARKAKLDVLVPDDAAKAERPILAAMLMSALVEAANGLQVIEFSGRPIKADCEELQQLFDKLNSVQLMPNLFQQCVAIMFPTKVKGAMGELCCMRQKDMFRFVVFEHSAPPNIKWEIHRDFLPA